MRFAKLTRFAAGVALLGAVGAAWASDFRGVVTFNGLPVPGASVTLTEGGKKLTAVTDQQGFYSISATDGDAALDVQMTGFAPVHKQVKVAADAPLDQSELEMLSPEAMLAALKPVPAAPMAEVQQKVQATVTAKPKRGDEKNADTGGAAAVPDETAQKAAEGLLINGSVNNAATSQYSLANRFGNTASGKALYQFMLDVQESNSALDAKSYSITGVDIAKPQTNQLTGGVAVMGPFKIPGLVRNGPQMFVGYQRIENAVAVTTVGLVPTAAERCGNLADEVDANGNPITIYNPSTGQPYAGNQVPVSAQAAAILGPCPLTVGQQSANSGLYPLPNQPLIDGYNYQAPVVTDTHTDQMNSNANKTIGRRDQIFASFAFQKIHSSNANLFGFVDATHSLGMIATTNWSHTFNQHYRANVTYSYSRYAQHTIPFWENRENIEGQPCGSSDPCIGGTATTAPYSPSQNDPTYFGPPSLTFSNGIAGLNDANPLLLRNETNAITLLGRRSGPAHNITVGIDFKRREFNYLMQANPRGTFTFTGAATEAPQSSGGGGSTGSTGTTGSAFADFLIGVPDASQVNFGNPDKYLRETLVNLYATDDWRLMPQLTINAGVRWEYQGPVSEIKDRLVNLDVAGNFANVEPVLASSPTGPLTGQRLPNSLMRPDYATVQPRIGVTWRPIPASSLVLSAGYGLYYDTSVYQGLAIQMAQQAPLATSLNLENSSACPLTLANGFPTNCTTTSPESFGVDPNFRIGYLQTWNLKVQKDLPASLQMVATYLGNKGTRGVQEFLPNTLPPTTTGTSCTGPCGFLYLRSTGDSTREAGSIQLRRRLKSGFTASVLYTYSKSIDDDSSLGGQGASTSSSATIAQDWTNLRAERGLSTFDQRHVVNASAQYTTGMGMHGGTLLSGWRGAVYKEWTLQATLTAASGLPETPLETAATVAGHTSFVRPDATGQPINVSTGGRFVNPAAFTPPAAGAWGTARRDSIEGPRQLDLDAAMLRTFRLPDKMTLDVELQATNVLNHVTYSSWVTNINSLQFGVPAAANTMRVVTASGRFRF